MPLRDYDSRKQSSSRFPDFPLTVCYHRLTSRLISERLWTHY